MLFDDNKIKMTRKPGKKQKENTVGCAGEGNIRKGSREDKTGTVLDLSLYVSGTLMEKELRERFKLCI